ncbi:YcaO-like family protein [Microbacterium foliorum]|nr:YcaO-like family protein [Microbacterium foliorum]
MSWAAGRGRSVRERAQSARGEAVERQTILSRASGVMAAQTQLCGPVLEPRALGVDLPGERPDGVLPVTAELPVRWEKYTSVNEAEPVWVHEPLSNEDRFYDLTSNGTAVHRSAELALRSATLELIERDAFMAWWYGVSSARPLAVLTTTLTAGYNMTGVGVGDYETVVLESRPGYFVLMCVVYVGGRDSPEGVVVGAAAGFEDEGVELPMKRAFDECVQAIDVMRLNAAVNSGRIAGPLGEYYTDPHRAVAVREHVERSLSQPRTALLEEPLSIYSRCAPSAVDGYWFARVVAPEAVPFALQGHGLRRNHPSLHGQVLHTPDGLKPEEHPLG